MVCFCVCRQCSICCCVTVFPAMCEIRHSYTTPPGLSAVTGVMVTSTTGYANLWWNEVPNANGYLVYVNQTTTATSSITNVTTGVMVTIPISCGQPYTFGVQAYNDVGYSDVSPLVQLNSCSASCELCTSMSGVGTKSNRAHVHRLCTSLSGVGTKSNRAHVHRLCTSMSGVGTKSNRAHVHRLCTSMSGVGTKSNRAQVHRGHTRSPTTHANGCLPRPMPCLLAPVIHFCPFIVFSNILFHFHCLPPPHSLLHNPGVNNRCGGGGHLCAGFKCLLWPGGVVCVQERQQKPR